MRSFLFASLLFAGACSTQAYADQPTIGGSQAIGPRTALAIAPAKTRAPYDVQVMREDGEALPTYAYKDRFYVQGNIGERYIIHVTNPTAHRVEAVVSVDGLDVIDGNEGDLHKRGYIVPAGGDVRIEGFRTSLDDVATFRFSSVDGSYAGGQGKARNVGVIAVAIFEEQAAEQQQVIVQDTPTPAPAAADKRKYDYRDDIDASASRAPAPTPVRPTTTASAPPPAANTAPSGGAAASRPAPAPPPAPRKAAKGNYDDDGDASADYERAPTEETPTATHRPGLGTEFGEQRSSGATYTHFVRAGAPVAIAELRYNDMAGLAALGIPVQPLPDDGEIMTRETAEPFPGDQRFAQPPR